MSADLPSWPRSQFQPGGGNAHLFFKLHGRFSGTPEIVRERYRTAGLPRGCSLQSFPQSSEAFRFGLDGPWNAPELIEATKATPQCLILRGEIEDPPNLDYLRDAVGLVTALLDEGGVSIFDPLRFTWWSPSDWAETLFEPNGPVPRQHAIIMSSDEPDGTWLHTRGMLKFGRPDVSVHRVTPELEQPVLELINRTIEFQALGGIVPDGEAIRMRGLPEGWVCRHRGSLDDPDFNNRHLEMGPA